MSKENKFSSLEMQKESNMLMSEAPLNNKITDSKNTSINVALKESKSRKTHISHVSKNKRKYNYPNNFVKTSKYNIFDFFPKALLFQFARYANCYFLLIAIVQLIPQVSPLSPVTAIAPLVIVLLISITREGIEDYYRHKSDEKENTEKVFKYDGKSFVQDLSKNLEIGDVVRVDEYGVIPADLVIVSCSNLTKIAYLETANLDGEKNLKPKFCVPQIFSIFKDVDSNFRLKGTIINEMPNSDLQKFNGRFKINQKHDYSVTIKQFLYKGTILKNTKWAIGVVVYSGKETKIILNSQRSASKTSHLEILVNKLIIIIFGAQICLCIVLAIISSIWNMNYQNTTYSYLMITTDPNLSGLMSFWSYLLLLNTMIPISLIVSIEVTKYVQGFFMENDVEMYSSVRDK